MWFLKRPHSQRDTTQSRNMKSGAHYIDDIAQKLRPVNHEVTHTEYIHSIHINMHVQPPDERTCLAFQTSHRHGGANFPQSLDVAHKVTFKSCRCIEKLPAFSLNLLQILVHTNMWVSSQQIKGTWVSIIQCILDVFCTITMYLYILIIYLWMPTAKCMLQLMFSTYSSTRTLQTRFIHV